MSSTPFYERIKNVFRGRPRRRDSYWDCPPCPPETYGQRQYRAEEAGMRRRARSASCGPPVACYCPPVVDPLAAPYGGLEFSQAAWGSPAPFYPLDVPQAGTPVPGGVTPLPPPPGPPLPPTYLQPGFPPVQGLPGSKSIGPSIVWASANGAGSQPASAALPPAYLPPMPQQYGAAQ
eukprot:RCo020428